MSPTKASTLDLPHQGLLDDASEAREHLALIAKLADAEADAAGGDAQAMWASFAVHHMAIKAMETVDALIGVVEQIQLTEAVKGGAR